MIARLNGLTRLASISRVHLKKALPCASRLAFSSEASATSAASSKESARPASRLLRQLTSELTAQETLIKEAGEDMDPAAVLEEFSGFLQNGGWKVNHENGSAVLKISRNDEALQGSVSINVDLNDVMDSAAFNDEMNQETFASEEAEASENAEEMEEAGEFGNYSSFPVVVEVNRGGKTLAFECLAEQSDDSCTLSVENVSLRADSAGADAYNGPVYQQLDEDLKEAFDQFVGKIVKPEEMIDFIQIYSQAVESHEYKNWLQSVKTMLN